MSEAKDIAARKLADAVDAALADMAERAKWGGCIGEIDDDGSVIYPMGNGVYCRLTDAVVAVRTILETPDD